jgi:hypothetical protein
MEGLEASDGERKQPLRQGGVPLVGNLLRDPHDLHLLWVDQGGMEVPANPGVCRYPHEETVLPHHLLESLELKHLIKIKLVHPYNRTEPCLS